MILIFRERKFDLFLFNEEDYEIKNKNKIKIKT